MNRDVYQSPLQSRYASKEMSFLFSPRCKYRTWRRLWTALARAQKRLGLPITDEMMHELEAHIDTINFDKVAAYEKECRHEVMAHIKAYADECPNAQKIIHLGATSSYVMDNTMLIQMKHGIDILLKKLRRIFAKLEAFSRANAAIPCLSYTHFQPAQPTTVGKRASSWIQDLLIDYRDLKNLQNELVFLGVKGATGTQASFLSLMGNDERRVRDLEKFVAAEMGFERCFPIATQTYPRKIDMQVVGRLAGLGASAHKFAGDIRLLCHLGEISEPFQTTQVGSSAMPYKKNPILCERICSLARYLISHFENTAYNASLQWLERTLDDSANRRLSISESFLCADSVLNLLYKVCSGLVTHPKMVKKNLQKELPFLATETLLMLAVESGKDRQEVHEKLRHLSMEARKKILDDDEAPDLLKWIINDKSIGLSKQQVADVMRVENFTGRAEKQTLEFLDAYIVPLLPSAEEKSQPILDPEI